MGAVRGVSKVRRGGGWGDRTIAASSSRWLRRSISRMLFMAVCGDGWWWTRRARGRRELDALVRIIAIRVFSTTTRKDSAAQPAGQFQGEQ